MFFSVSDGPLCHVLKNMQRCEDLEMDEKLEVVTVNVMFISN